MGPVRARVPGLVIVCHPDARRVGEEAALPALASGEEVRLSRLEPEFLPPGDDGAPRPLAAPHLSRTPLVLRPGPEPGGVTLERVGSRTRVAVRGEEVAGSTELSAAEVERGVVFVLSRRVALLLCWLDPVPLEVPRYALVGESAEMVRLRQDVRSAVDLEVPVLLRGETGTGKELVARALHDAGPRCRRPFVSVNMAALPPALAASELFGAVRGAYTGADRAKAGFFQSAEGGTLFLDEIGEVPVEVQTLLLRALENREIQPVGSVETRRVDVRVIAATDSDLDAAIAQGRFRAPLLHRLEGYEIRLPALRERRDDVARLLFHFLREELARLGASESFAEEGGLPWPPAEVVARLVDHDWPGNVRQLRNVARRLAISRRQGRHEEPAALVERLLRDVGSPRPGETQPGEIRPRFRKPAQVGEEELLEALAAHRWRLQPAARALGVSRATLYRLIESSSRIRKAAEIDAGEITAALERADGDADAAARQLEVSPQGLKRRITALGLGPGTSPRG